MRAKMPVDNLNKVSLSGDYIGGVLNEKILDDYGLFVIKGALPKPVIEKYATAYTKYKNSSEFDRNHAHLTEVRFGLDNQLASILKEPEFMSVAQRLFPQGVGIYNIRIVKKDKEDSSPVFLHQDVGYQHGSFERYSLFIPLTNCCLENGGLSFVPGSHKFGYLGDAGAIKESVIPQGLELVTPGAEPGDVIVMNSYTWHQSGKNQTGAERVYYDIHVNRNTDPASKVILSGSSEREYTLGYDVNDLFENSRLQRLEKFSQKYGKI